MHEPDLLEASIETPPPRPGVVQRMVGRINRVRGYMEARGFRVGRGTYDLDGMNLETVDIDRLDAQEINGAWTAYDRSDSREAVWAMIATAREAIKRFAPNESSSGTGLGGGARE